MTLGGAGVVIAHAKFKSRDKGGTVQVHGMGIGKLEIPQVMFSHFHV